MKSRSIYFPEAHEIAPLAVAFAQMMFAHAQFEREVRELQGVVTRCADFGEQPDNQWSTKARPKLMAKLIKEHLGVIPEAQPIRKILKDAISACHDRNVLAHGEWWHFDGNTSAIDVRGGTQWKKGRIDHRPWTVTDISAITEKFKDLEAALYILRRDIKQRGRKDTTQR